MANYTANARPEDLPALKDIKMRYGRTPSGIATEMLRLVARVGAQGYMEFLNRAYRAADEIELSERRKAG